MGHTVDLVYQAVTNTETGTIEVTADGDLAVLTFDRGNPRLKLWRAILSVANDRIRELEQQQEKAQRTVTRELHENWKPITQGQVFSVNAWFTDRFKVWHCIDHVLAHHSPMAQPESLKGATHYWHETGARFGCSQSPPPLYKEPQS